MTDVEIAVYAFLHGGYRTRNSIISHFVGIFSEHDVNHALSVLFSNGKIETIVDGGIHWKVALE